MKRAEPSASSSNSPYAPYRRSTSQVASALTSMTAVPTSSAESFHGGRSRYAVTLKSAGIRKSRSRRVANLISPRIRETRNVRRRSSSASRSMSSPTTYQMPFISHRPYGFTRALGLAVGRDRPVAEPHGALLGDRLLELREPGGDLVGVERGQELHGRRLRPGVGARPGPAQREVLEREPQGLGVGELALQQVETGLERRELVVGERRSAAGSTAPRAGCRAPPR